MFIKILARLLAGCLFLTANSALAQAYPNHVVRIILPYPPA